MSMYRKVLKRIAYLQLKKELKRYANYGFTMISVRSLRIMNAESFKDELMSDGFALGYTNDKLQYIIWV